ncbi:uncharacterized protein DSM5745_04813 [Aspergillus mulundensis]|uniref:Major facilitator superfamily (MFS) profile domain-containing protein n=1 Tax=Aspergillus mulundensis TaxID=1810919 RepID=A0A3D8S4S9_9EURO|nr:Uncharacterized protein DSM5745_04813 [Aspergillus mulundensis]RDW81256.1 Uncharacterized protein DSM5745_04813 [Aspergillus mulundensis]
MPLLVGKTLSLAITATAGSGFLLFGYDQGVMSGLLTGDAFVRTFPEIDTTEGGHGNSSLQGTVGVAFGAEQSLESREGDYGMSYVSNESQFRFPLALQILFAIVTFLGVLVLPESPRWLIAHDRHTEARQVLWSVQPNARLITPDDPAINLEITSISRTVAEERQATEAGSFKMLLQDGPQRIRHRTLLAMGGQMMQQLSGVNLITYYNTVIFEQSVGMSHNLALLMAGFNGVAYFVSTFVPVWVIDRLGRRKLMLFAAGGQCACMAILAGTVYDGGHAAGIVATVMLFLFNFFFGVGLLAVPWLLPAEYAPLATRTHTAALATATNWIFTFLVVEITPVSISNIGYRTYIYFAVFNFCFLPLIFFFYPETRNLTLEQIDRLFTGEKVRLHWDTSMGVAGDTEHRLQEKTGDAEVQHVE